MGTGWIAITIGDAAGIGPEVSLKAIQALGDSYASKFVLIGDAATIHRANVQFGTGLSFSNWESRAATTRLAILDPLKEPLPDELPPGNPISARAAYASLTASAQLCLQGEVDGMVTAPVSKAAIIQAGIPFVGQTERLSELANAARTAMMLMGEDDRGRWLRVALVTTHLPIKSVAQNITREKVELAIELAAAACQRLRLPRQRVGVCGLNPHAGEGGELGDEEIRFVTPAVENMRASGFNVDGPHAADSLFYYAYKGDYDAVVAMYHDQGLAPLKMIGFEKGINWTLGLPFIRTSPDHGTAFNIAGQGIANPSSMMAAIRLATDLARRD